MREGDDDLAVRVPGLDVTQTLGDLGQRVAAVRTGVSLPSSTSRGDGGQLGTVFSGGQHAQVLASKHVDRRRRPARRRDLRQIVEAETVVRVDRGEGRVTGPSPPWGAMRRAVSCRSSSACRS